MASKSIDLRCTCSRRPLLAKAGRDTSGRPFVHVKVFKQRRVYGEIIVTEGIARILCRECFRWYVVRIVRKTNDFNFQQEPLPEAIPVGS